MGNVPTTTNSTAAPCVCNVTKNYMGKFQNYWLVKETSGKPDKYKPLVNNVMYCLVTDNGLFRSKSKDDAGTYVSVMFGSVTCRKQKPIHTFW